MNPWGLTESQQQVLAAMIEHGTDKAVARVLGLQPQTVKTKMWHIRQRMGASTKVVAAVMWDRFTRGHLEAR